MRHPGRHPGRNRARAWFAALVVLGLVVLASSTELGLGLRRGVARALEPVRQVVTGVGEAVVGLAAAPGEAERLDSENERLRASLAAAEQRIVELDEAGRENAELRALLSIGKALDMDLLPVRITGRDPPSLGWEVSVDAGSRDGVEVGMPVLAGTAGGRRTGALVGTVVEVDDDSARVRLVVDTASVVVGRDQQSRALGEVRGQAGGGLVFVNVPASETLAVGDRVMSAGLRVGDHVSRYPAGVLLGTIHVVEADANGVTQTAYVDPAVDPRHVERLLIVLKFSQG